MILLYNTSEGTFMLKRSIAHTNEPAGFDDNDRKSAEILGMWAEKAGRKRKHILEQLLKTNRIDDAVGEKTFTQWFKIKRVSAHYPELLGNRLVAVVQWFVTEHLDEKKHYDTSIIDVEDLEDLIRLYPDIPAQNRFQLKRLLSEVKLSHGHSEADPYALKDWEQQISELPIFGLVVDQFGTIRAYTKYTLELAEIPLERLKQWVWWQRIAFHLHDSGLRGSYAEPYYFHELLWFRWNIKERELESNPHLLELLTLLKSSPEFARVWNDAEEAFANNIKPATLLPVPFFRSDGAVLWLVEVNVPISQENG